jgi:adenosylmethionine-8-amino-7-oxononanoate aminotransferase
VAPEPRRFYLDGVTLPEMIPPRPALERAEGLFVWDTAGRRYLDATSGAFCMQLGYTRPDLVAAMSETASRLPHARPSLFQSQEGEAYAEALLAVAGAPFTRVWLTSSGSEAVELAIKAAWWYQRARGQEHRDSVLSLSGHYHGATLAALDMTGLRDRREPYEDLLGPRSFGPPAHCPNCFRKLTHPSCALACADEALKDSEEAIAFLAETVPAAGLAAAVPPAGWVARVRERCDEAGTLWIADEVLTGFGRTGALFAWQRLAERDGVTAVPDLVAFGKGASAGFYPLAGVLVSERVAQALDAEEKAPFRHVQTFGGGPVACAVGLRALRAYADERVFERVRETESDARHALERFRANDAVVDVRGLGLLWGIELGDLGRGRPFPRSRRIAEGVTHGCRARGVLVHGAAGFLPDGNGDAILIAPPLVADAEILAAIAGVALESVESVAPRSGERSWVEEWEDR